MNSKNITVALIISIAILSRLIYHPPNFTPLFSVCIFSGMMFKQKRLMFLVPFLCMFISDLIIGLHDTLLFVYLSFTIVILLGKKLNDNYSFSKLLGTIFASNLIFFLITNFAVWYFQYGFYEHSIRGLLTCYYLALPFVKNSLLSNLFFTPCLIYSYKYIENKYPIFLKT